ncbi:MAG: hypothetical protein J7K68_06445 [Candidatus Diapherotrites archaeon]|nr:hypothetical protein [Candidatus Diapherotrites archaeon]
MGLEEELRIVNILKKYGMNYIHRLKQSTISDFIKNNNSTEARVWIEKNKALPRRSYTYEVDIFAWKPDHWAALSIEEKTQKGTEKQLRFDNNGMLMVAGSNVLNSADDLFLQCCGAGYLGKAFSIATGMDHTVLPIGLVDYSIDVLDTPSRWALYNGVLFVNKQYFEHFLRDFLKEKSWVREVFTNALRRDN